MDTKTSLTSNFRKFFFRGLAILLPSILTVWILMAAYGFVTDRIAKPINAGVRELIVQLTPWPTVVEEQIMTHRRTVEADPLLSAALTKAQDKRGWLRRDTRRQIVVGWWKQYPFPLDLIGVVIAVVLIYIVGGLVGSFIGHNLYRRGERILQKIPLVRQVYPSVKQVTDVLLGSSEEKIKFNRVVAVEYPRKGLWSVGLVTGDTMQTISSRAGNDCLTVFIPSSPTPFTGYVITVPRNDTIDLRISIDEALRFTISGGVIIPISQQTRRADPTAVHSVTGPRPAPGAGEDIMS